MILTAEQTLMDSLAILWRLVVFTERFRIMASGKTPPWWLCDRPRVCAHLEADQFYIIPFVSCTGGQSQLCKGFTLIQGEAPTA